MGFVDPWPGRYELSMKLASLEQDEIGPQVRCCPFPLTTPAMDCVFQDPQLLMMLVSAAGLPAARACRATRRALGKELQTSMPVLYASAMPSIYVIGGACRNLGVLNVMKRLDAGGTEWQPVPSMPSSRRLCAATACNGYLYVFGGEAVSVIPGTGFIPNSLNTIDGMLRDYIQLDCAERFGPLHGTWEVLPPMPTARAGCAATTADGLIYVCGGRLCETVLAAVERFDPGIERWEMLPRQPTARSGCAAATAKGCVYIMGGKCSNGRVQGVAERFHPTFGRWEKLPPMLSPRSAFAAGTVGDLIYAAGGFNGSIALSSVECFDPSTGFWA
ncbi:klhl12, partial [Symbiodinium microadriaticum]